MTQEDDDLNQAYVTQLRSEHKRVNHYLAQIDQQLQCCRRRQRSAADIGQLISSSIALRSELAHHFSEEEEGGCVEEAVSHKANLGRQADDLKREDHKLLKQLDGLIDKLRTAPQSMKLIEKDFRQFVQAICQHEAAESRIVDEGLGSDDD